MAEQKVSVEINGKIVRVAPHMVKDLLKFGASVTPRAAKAPPQELTTIPLPKKLILPRTPPEVPEPPKIEAKLPEPPRPESLKTEDVKTEPIDAVVPPVVKKTIKKTVKKTKK